MDFALGAEHQAVLEVAKQVADSLAPGALDRDISGQFPAEMLRTVGQAGLLGLDTPEEAGGQGAGSVVTGLVAEELAAADYLAGSFIVQSSTGSRLLHKFAAPEVAEEWLPQLLAGNTTLALALTEAHTGSDLADIRVRARHSGNEWRITGEKTSVSFPRSAGIVVLARTDDGPALLLVRSSDAIATQRLDDVGARALGRSVMTFDAVPPADITLLTQGQDSLRAVFGSLVTARLLVCMTALGVARAAADEADDWARQRYTFGAPLSQRQGIAFPAVDAAIDIELGRLLALKGLWLADQGLPHDREAAMAKAWIPPRMFDICHWALQVCGHPAYTREHRAQMRLRDVLATEIGEGATNIQRLILARQMFGTRPG